jgi:hypothetical protein
MIGDMLAVLLGILCTIINIINAPVLLTLVTGVVGVVALYIYKNQRKDIKQEAALALYYEVKSAEEHLADIKEKFFSEEQPSIRENKTVMDYESWNKFKHLFTQTLKPEEWKSVDEFYRNCLAYDNAVKTEATYFLKYTDRIGNKIAEYSQEKLETFHQENISNAKNPKSDNQVSTEIEILRKDFIAFQALLRETSFYSPKKQLNDARKALVKLNTGMTSSPAGIKLGEIAGIKN